MSYTNIEFLPASVKASLTSAEDRNKWLTAFNSSYAKSTSFSKATADAFASFKDSASLRYHEGWLSTDHLDVQGDVMCQNGLLDALQKHVDRGGAIVDLHSNRIVGSIYKVELRKYDSNHMGIYGFGVINQNEPYFNEIWKQINDGKKNGFSIGGFAVEWATECNAHGCHRKVTKPSIQEVSVCQKPADPQANMTHFNSFAKAKSVEIDPSHLANDRANLLRIKAIVEEMLSDDAKETDDTSLNGVNSNMLENNHDIPSAKEPETETEAQNLPEIKTCGCGNDTQIKKVGTHQGICRGHAARGHKTSSQCQGYGFSDKPILDPRKNAIITDDYSQRPKPFQPQIAIPTKESEQEVPSIEQSNDEESSKFARVFISALATEKDPRVRKAFEKSLAILAEKSGMPVKKRLYLIARLGCPRCDALISEVRREKIQTNEGLIL